MDGDHVTAIILGIVSVGWIILGIITELRDD